MSAEGFEVVGVRYRARKMNAILQLQVGRRVIPLFKAIPDDVSPAMLKAQGFSALKALGPMMDVIASLPDADVEFIINKCLAHAERQNGGGTGWSPVATLQGDVMFSDVSMDASATLQIAFGVIKENLSGFFTGAADLGKLTGDAGVE